MLGLRILHLGMTCVRLHLWARLGVEYCGGRRRSLWHQIVQELGGEMTDSENEGRRDSTNLPSDSEVTKKSDDHTSVADTMSAVKPAADVASSEPQPEHVPGYRIIRLLGRGGMGVVWEAEQERPRRRVALKVMRRDHLVDDVHTRMFFREAETLARLKHPNIASIYESGHTDDGHDYFAMELVVGDTLDRWLRSRPAIIDSNELRLRLKLFNTICEAVHYAHQRGVIHRDLKPSNIIVTEGPVLGSGSSHSDTGPTVKILDFGLARITDADVAATMVSEVGLIKGTLQYMSPEQARGDVTAIDVRTDVYALGVILYELLAGERPYDVSRSAIAEAVRVICEEPPKPLPRGGATRIGADLATIVAKALEKEMDRRYGSASALGEDVERYLTSQPILARPPSAVYQMRKFAARNRAIVFGAAATLMVLIAGVVVSTSLGLREAAQRRAAEQAKTDLEAVAEFQSRMLASVDPSRMGRELISDLRDRVLTEVRDDGGSDSQVAAAAASFDDLMRGVNTTDAALNVIDRQILARAVETIDSDFKDRPEIALRLRATIGDTYGELGLLTEAEAQERLVFEGSKTVLGADHPDTLEAGRKLGQELMFLGRYDEAEELLIGVIESQRRVLGDDDPATLRSRRVLADVLGDGGKNAEAESAFQDVLDVQRRVLGPDHPDTMATMNSLAMLLSDAGRPEAESLMLELYATSQRTWGEEDPMTLVYEHNLARIYQRQGRDEKAAERNEHVLEVRRRVLGNDHPRTLRSKASLADSYARLGRFEEARDLFAEVHEDRRRTLGPDHPDTIESIGSMAVTTKQMGRFEEAEPYYQAALEGRARVLGPEHPWTLATKYGMADLYWRAGRPDDAERLFLETIAAQKKVLGPENRQTLRSQMVLAQLYEELERDQEAEKLYVETSVAQLRSMGDADPESLGGLYSVAEFYIRRGRFDDAEGYATRGLELATRALGDENPSTLHATFNLAWLRTKQHRYEEAEALYTRILPVQERTLGRDHVDTANTLQNLGCVYRDWGRYDEARSLFEEVSDIQEAAYGPDHRWIVGNLEDYVKLLRLTGENRHADELEERIRKIKPHLN